MKSIAFFNNKGGVGKTTLVCNLAHYLASVEEKRVLIVDLDPQCNSTQLLLTPEQCAHLYWPEEALGDEISDLWGDVTNVETIYDAVRPLEEGEGSTSPVTPVPAAMNRFAVDIIPGHPRMSVFEDKLGQWFLSATSGDIDGLRKTLWLNKLIEPLETEYDVILFDLGPSLGALNRSVLAASDYFVTPMGADIFSIVALRNIAEWLGHWSRLYMQGVQLCQTNNPGAVERYSVPEQLRVDKGFAGFTVQQYSTVTIRGERRATVAYDQILNQIPSQVERHLHDLAIPGLDVEALKLGDVPNLRSLVPLAQSANTPLAALTSRDGLAGGQYSQQRSYTELINNVGARLTQNCLSS
ncbi:AAA domain-containing protein [Plantibacter sp. VKM Ac-1784]|uniref:AAA domain-containing protein n=1 Tax=Plantibacter elymi (nom. nud.) TaxID=199708 RepID=A0ABY1R7H5_9MICO|nr:ParA family protein [Plantibacter sp. VKM Ac-1784]SMQ58093.1 AAA domain-containing protein [Plantibacter sp. VKM Ac-1784]